MIIASSIQIPVYLREVRVLAKGPDGIQEIKTTDVPTLLEEASVGSSD